MMINIATKYYGYLYKLYFFELEYVYGVPSSHNVWLLCSIDKSIDCYERLGDKLGRVRGIRLISNPIYIREKLTNISTDFAVYFFDSDKIYNNIEDLSHDVLALKLSSLL